MTEIKNKLYQVISLDLNGMTYYISSKGYLNLNVPFEEVKKQLGTNENIIISKKTDTESAPVSVPVKNKTVPSVKQENIIKEEGING